MTGNGSSDTVTSIRAAPSLPGDYPNLGPTNLTTGNLTFAGGGHYYWQINNATGTAGANWSTITCGALNITASSGSPFIIDVSLLTAGNGLGLPANFNPATPYSWTIAAATSVTGFSANAFAFTSSACPPSAFSVSAKRQQPGAQLHTGAAAGNQPDRQRASITPRAESLEVNTNSTVTFIATAMASAPMNYQWKQNGTAVTNGTRTDGAVVTGSSGTLPGLVPGTATLTITNFGLAEAGTYSCLFSNVDGSTNSAAVLLQAAIVACHRDQSG